MQICFDNQNNKIAKLFSQPFKSRFACHWIILAFKITAKNVFLFSSQFWPLQNLKDETDFGLRRAKDQWWLSMLRMMKVHFYSTTSFNNILLIIISNVHSWIRLLGVWWSKYKSNDTILTILTYLIYLPNLPTYLPTYLTYLPTWTRTHNSTHNNFTKNLIRKLVSRDDTI